MKELVVFGQEGCMPCRMVKNKLSDEEKLFNDAGITITYKDLATDRPEFEKHGISSTPVSILFVDGEEKERIHKFNPNALDNLK